MIRKILLTGGCGFIGSNLIRHLLACGKYEILNLDLLTYAGNPASLGEYATHPNYHFSRTDIREREVLGTHFREFQPDAVLHLAAESHVDRSIDGPDAFIQTNILGTYQLLQAALDYWLSHTSELSRSHFRFVHVSTDEVFGSLGDSGLFCETTRYDPHSPYSASKAASDHLVRAWYDTYGLPTIVTNCSNNYGPYQFPEKLIPVVIIKALHNEPIPVYGSGDNIRDWLYVEDHASALKTVLASGQPGETYNIGGNNELRNIDLVRILCSLMDELHPHPEGKPHASAIAFVTDRPGHDKRYAIDAGKIRRELGWSPAQDSSSGFRKTVQWYLDNKNWWQSILEGKHRMERLGQILHKR